jgi:hypothetical protein
MSLAEPAMDRLSLSPGEQYLVRSMGRDAKQQGDLLSRLHGKGLERKALLS